MATATSSVRISDSAAGATPGITPFGRSQAGCPCHSDGGGGGSGIDSKKLTPSGYFLQSATVSAADDILAATGHLDRCRTRRFAARLSGLASGLALAVRPAGSAEISARDARHGSGSCWSTWPLPGDPDNARRSAARACDTLPATGALGVTLTARPCRWRARQRDTAGTAGGRSPGVPCAARRRVRRCSRPGPSGPARRRCALDDREENPHSIDMAAVGSSRRRPGYGYSGQITRRIAPEALIALEFRGLPFHDPFHGRAVNRRWPTRQQAGFAFHVAPPRG